MTPEAALMTKVLAWGTLLLQLWVVKLLVVQFYESRRGMRFKAMDMVRSWATHIMFALALGGSIMTLVYSEVFGFAPCGLCWLQRVFLYPSVILLGMALWKRDARIHDYIIGLSIPGLLIALYQHYLQVGGTSFLPCPASPGAADCAQRLIFEFGYITFPLMAATLFAALIVLAWMKRSEQPAA